MSEAALDLNESEAEAPALAAVPAGKAARTAGVYVVLGRNAAGSLIWAEKATRKEFRDSINDLLAAGGKVEAAFRGARKLEAKVKQVVHF